MKVLQKVLWTTIVLAGLVVVFAPAPAAADICYNDDLIVDGSLCVGFDCVCNHSFGFDTIVLKENNLRIFFDDTSVAGSYPRNDWRIIINDSANGGASYFGIEDSSAGRIPFRVVAGARSNALYVDAQGDVGIGTSTPSVEVHAVRGDTPTLRLEQDGSSGFTPQTWDVAGNETNFFIRDVTHGSTLPFRIRPDAPGSSIFVDVDGDVGLGTSSPDAILDLERTSAGDKTVLRISNNGKGDFLFQNTASAGANDTWTMSHANNGVFAIEIGGGNSEFRLQQDGDLLLDGNLQACFGAGCAQTNFPDYVFEPDYDLMEMDELEAFVQREKHLPGVLSRHDVEKARSINMTQLQLQLLEKVEELTLYTLSQQRVIEALEGRLAELEQVDDAELQQ